MLDKAMKQLASDYNMARHGDCAYGYIRGYAATLRQGIGWKAVMLSVHFSDAAKRVALHDKLNTEALLKTYQLREVTAWPDALLIEFQSEGKVMSNIRGFLDWLIPELEEARAGGENICPDCGEKIVDGCWVLTGDIARHMDKECAAKRAEEIRQHNENLEGSHLKGFLGAVLCSLVCGILLVSGASSIFLGLVNALGIGILAGKGYDRFHGKRDGKRLWLVLGATVAIALLGCFLSSVWTYTLALMSSDLTARDVNFFTDYLFHPGSWYYFGYNFFIYTAYAVLGALWQWLSQERRTDMKRFKLLDT